jgi:putative ABC transport system permease protein
MRPRWKKIFSDLLEHPVRSLLVIASITIGLFAIGMIITIYVALKADMPASISMANQANVQIKSDGFDQDFVDHIEKMPNVQSAFGEWAGSLRIATGDDEWSQINITASDDLDKKDIATVRLLSGKYPPEKHEIVVDVGKASDLAAGLGDTVYLKTANGTERAFTLVGIVRDLTIGSTADGGGYFVEPIHGYMDGGDLERMGLPDEFNHLLVTVTGDQNDADRIQKVSTAIQQEFEKYDIKTSSTVARLRSEHPTMAYLNAVVAVLIVIGLVMLFLGGFLITNTLSALLNHQMEQIGVMKTVGGNRIQINLVYVILILIYSLIALAISIPTAFWAGYALLEYMALKVNYLVLGHRLIPAAVAVQAVTAILIPQIAGYIPIHHGTKISIREALSGPSVIQGVEHNPFVRLLSRIKQIKRPLLISLRNTFRQKVRLILTLTTLVLGGAVFISTFNVRGSLDAYAVRINRYLKADVNITFTQPYRTARVVEDVQRVPGVASVEGWATGEAVMIKSDGLPGEAVQIFGVPPKTQLIQPTITHGRWIREGDTNALVVNETFDKYYPGLKMGDQIRLRVNGKTETWVVVGTFQFAGISSGMIAYTDYDYLSKMTHLADKSALFRVVSDTPDGSFTEQSELARRIETLLEDEGYSIVDVQSGKAMQENVAGGLNILIIVLMVMALLMAVVGSISLTGTMSLNTMERTREIGIMRAIGASDQIIINMVLVEGLIIGTISCILSIIVAVPITLVMGDAISQAVFGASSTFVYLPIGVIIWVVLENLLAVVSSVLPARNAAHLTIREVLTYE